MAGELIARIGKTLTDEEQKKIDTSKVAKLQANPPGGDVEPQSSTIAICPNCGCFGYDISPIADHYLLCHCCGVIFLMA